MPTPRNSGGAIRARETLTVSLADARQIPPGDSPRLRCRHYDAPPKFLPNGLPRTTPLVADALLEIGGAFLVTARILRDAPGQPASRLQVEREARDTDTGRLVLLPPYGPGLLRACYDVMASKQVLVNARRQVKEARN